MWYFFGGFILIIVAIVAVAVAVMILTGNSGVGVLSPPAIGVLTAAVVVGGFSLFARHPAVIKEPPHASS